MGVTIETGISEGITADPMVPALFRVDRVKQETEDTFTLGLVPDEAITRFSYLPGQFNMLYVFGVGEVPISISGDPSVTSRLEHTTRRVGTVTAAMGQLRAGDMIGVRGPFGTHWPVAEEAGRDVLIVAEALGRD